MKNFQGLERLQVFQREVLTFCILMPACLGQRWCWGSFPSVVVFLPGASASHQTGPWAGQKGVCVLPSPYPGTYLPHPSSETHTQGSWSGLMAYSWH